VQQLQLGVQKVWGERARGAQMGEACCSDLWAWVQAEVNAEGCESFAEFKQCVLHTLQNVPIKVLKGLIGSMRSRLEQCIARNGGLTDY
jgi:hypothetical protein